MTAPDEPDDPPQSLISVADIAMACVVALVIWFTIGAFAMVLGLLWMCG